MRLPRKGTLRPIGKTGIRFGIGRRREEAFRASGAGGTVYIGPSTDGADREYVKVISGQVADRKPSFA